MAMKKEIVITLFISILLILPVFVAEEINSTGSTDFTYTSVDEFFNDIPAINEELQLQEVFIPDSAGYLIKNGNIFVAVAMSDGSTREFYITLEDKRLIGISTGKPEEIEYTISTSEDTCNEIISSENPADAILSNYDNGNIKLKAVGIGNKIKLFFAKIFIGFS